MIQPGFILTRNSQDQFQQTEIQLWATTEQGPALLRLSGEKPVFFIEQQDPASQIKIAQAKIKPLSLNTFSHNAVSGVYSQTINDSFRAQDYLQNQGATLYETDIRLHDRYLMERFIHAGIQIEGTPVQKQGYIEYQQPKIKSAQYTPNLKLLSLDIECSLQQHLFSVGLSGCNHDLVLMIGSAESVKDTIQIIWCVDEKQLLQRLIRCINQLDPDVIIGWHVINFDLRILFKKCKHYGMNFNIGRAAQPAYWRTLRGETDKGFFGVPGRVVIDGIEALKTATYQFSSFSLEKVAQTLLGKGKNIKSSVENRAEEIEYNFIHHKTKLAAYNLEDCRLVKEIFNHTKMIDFLTLRSEITGLELGRIGGSVAAFTNLYFPKLHRTGYVAPNLNEEGGLTSPGGYVMDSKPGFYKNVLVLDFKSLYPSIIRTFKIDPVGLIEGLKNTDNSIPGFKGAFFHREKHHLPEIITLLWRQRDVAKQNKDAARSQAIKILMNSFYGVLGSSGCHFYDPKLASSITLRGHEIMQTTKIWIEELGYTVIYGDTDSIFVWVNPDHPIQDFKRCGETLKQIINQKWQDEIQQKFETECHLELEFETHFARFHMPTIRGSELGTKKRYAGLVHCDTKQADRLIFKGLETVRTDWTPLAKVFQTKLYDLIFHDQDPSTYIRDYVQDTKNGRYDDQLIYTKQLRKPLKLYLRNIPPHVKAARLADLHNKKTGKPLRYQNKGWICYVMTSQGPEPTDHHSGPYDYQHYIDKQLKPIADAILPAIGLDFDRLTDPQVTLFENAI